MSDRPRWVWRVFSSSLLSSALDRYRKVDVYEASGELLRGLKIRRVPHCQQTFHRWITFDNEDAALVIPLPLEHTKRGIAGAKRFGASFGGQWSGRLTKRPEAFGLEQSQAGNEKRRLWGRDICH